MNRSFSWVFPAAALIVLMVLSFLLTSHTPEVPASQTSQDKHPLHLIPSIPDALDLAGEEVPLEFFWVREGFDREILVNMYWHSSTLMILKRANRYFPIIEPILREEGIPDDFKYLAVIESQLLPAISPAGAAGIWQFMKKTGQEYGLRITDEVDERYHLEKSTRAACAYLNEARDTFGSWTLAAAAYNAGMGSIRRSLAEQQATNYYELWLNTETSRYVHRILAIKCIFENPEEYGFLLQAEDLYSPLKIKTETLDSGIGDLATYARSKGISYRALKELNPWMRGRRLPTPLGQPYTISLPEDEGRWYPR